MKKTLIVSLEVEGLHCWPDAPAEVSFLRHPHRHRFKFVIGIQVSRTDRQKEFFREQDSLRVLVATQLARGIDRSLKGLLDFGSASCELLAEIIVEATGARWAEVWEDGENGARIEREV